MQPIYALLGSRPGLWIGVAFMVALPWLVNGFVLVQIVCQALALGTIAMSLSFLAGQLGMVSLAQLSVAGAAAYTMAIVGDQGEPAGWGWPVWASLSLAMGISLTMGLLVGWLSARTREVYTIIITLALAIAFATLCLQNQELTNGFNGYASITPPQLWHAVKLPDGVPESLGVEQTAQSTTEQRLRIAQLNLYGWVTLLALLAWGLVLAVRACMLGLVFQGVRDNPERMRSLGYAPEQVRIVGFGLAGLMAGLGGVALVWFDGLISPGRVQVPAIVNILIVAMIGGIRRPGFAYLGAVVFVVLKVFAIDVVGPSRFNTLIGAVFLLIVVFSSDGLAGLLAQGRAKLTREASSSPPIERK